MGRAVIKMAAAAAVLAMAVVVLQGHVAVASGGRELYISVGQQTLPPFGWVDFCERYAHECDGGKTAPLDVNWTPEAIKAVRQVNSWVNTHVTPMSDMDHWGVVDQWDYPLDGYGDCEDYALMKRRMLIERGFPKQALLMTVVKDQHGEGHALLTVKTNKGEFVLDNLDEEVRPWNDTPYHFIKRQSQTDQNVWVDIADPSYGPLLVSR